MIFSSLIFFYKKEAEFVIKSIFKMHFGLKYNHVNFNQLNVISCLLQVETGSSHKAILSPKISLKLLTTELFINGFYEKIQLKVKLSKIFYIFPNFREMNFYSGYVLPHYENIKAKQKKNSYHKCKCQDFC